MAIRYSTLVDIYISIDIYAMYQLPDGVLCWPCAAPCSSMVGPSR